MKHAQRMIVYCHGCFVMLPLSDSWWINGLILNSDEGKTWGGLKREECRFDTKWRRRLFKTCLMDEVLQYSSHLEVITGCKTQHACPWWIKLDGERWGNNNRLDRSSFCSQCNSWTDSVLDAQVTVLEVDAPDLETMLYADCWVCSVSCNTSVLADEDSDSNANVDTDGHISVLN